MDFIEVLIVAAILMIVAVVGLAVYDESQRPDMGLKKDDWQCTKSENRTHLQPMGKLLMPMTTKICLEYTRIDG